MAKKSINVNKINAHKVEPTPVVKKTASLPIDIVDQAIANIHHEQPKEKIIKEPKTKNQTKTKAKRKSVANPRKRYVQAILDDETFIKLNEAIVREGFKSAKSFANYAIAYLLKEKGYIDKIGSPGSY